MSCVCFLGTSRETLCVLGRLTKAHDVETTKRELWLQLDLSMVSQYCATHLHDRTVPS